MQNATNQGQNRFTFKCEGDLLHDSHADLRYGHPKEHYSRLPTLNIPNLLIPSSTSTSTSKHSKKLKLSHNPSSATKPDLSITKAAKIELDKLCQKNNISLENYQLLKHTEKKWDENLKLQAEIIELLQEQINQETEEKKEKEKELMAKKSKIKPNKVMLEKNQFNGQQFMTNTGLRDYQANVLEQAQVYPSFR